jgi:hypothetical protein
VFNAADTFGGVDPEEIKFLKSNYEWAVQQGDIFLAESMKRYMAQFGKDAILIRHTLEEHLAAGGTIEDYNKDVATGVPIVFPVQHGTGSEAFLRDPVFKPEFLGKTTKADSAKLGYFFAGLQETANSYSSLAGYRPYEKFPEGLVVATDTHVTATNMRRELKQWQREAIRILILFRHLEALRVIIRQTLNLPQNQWENTLLFPNSIKKQVP